MPLVKIIRSWTVWLNNAVKCWRSVVVLTMWWVNIVEYGLFQCWEHVIVENMNDCPENTSVKEWLCSMIVIWLSLAVDASVQ